MATSAGGPRVADSVASAIREGGTTHAFGHPGGEVVVLIDALRKAGIRFTLAHHETEAAFMAAGYAELTGRPGVCVTTLGPGATNMVTGVASALLERAPLIALSGSMAEGAPAGVTHQQLALNDLFSPVAKASLHVGHGADAGELVARAVSIALAERPGPVHVSLPADVAQAPAEQRNPAHGRAEAGPLRMANAAALTTGIDLLSQARRPAIVVGLTSARMRVEASVRALAEALGAPVVTTPKAKGVVPERHPLFLGVIDMAGDRLIAETLEEADLIIAVGCDVVELDRRWTWDAPVMHVDVQDNVDGYYTADVEIVGDMCSSLEWLAEKAQASAWTPDEIQQRRRELLDLIQPTRGKALQPWHVVRSAQRLVAPDCLVTCDVGAHKMLVGQLWETVEPRRFFMANGLSSMGYAVPTAIAASLVDPDRAVLAFVGDGGLSMYLGELETAVREGTHMTVVVFADRSLELIRRAELRRGVETESVSFQNPDFNSIGQAYGIETHVVDSQADLEAALEGKAARGIRLVAAVIDGSHYEL